MNSRRLSFDLW